MMVRCNRELLSRYKDGEVTQQERSEIEAHLATCPGCAATLVAYKAIGRSIADLRRLRAAESMRGEVFTRIARQDGRPFHRKDGGSLFGTLLNGLALAGAAAVVILVLSVFFRSMNDANAVVLATAVYPPAAAAEISPASTIEVQFNRPMDKKSVEEAVKITPSVEANVAWEGEKIVLKPVDGLAANTSYTVTVGSKAKDVKGKPIKDSVVLSFRTGPASQPTSAMAAVLALATSTSTVAPSPTSSAEPITPTLTPSPTPTATPSPTATPTAAAEWPRLRLMLVDNGSPATIFAATSVGALYKSTDGGVSWRAIGSGLPAAPYVLGSLVVDPQMNRIVYAGTNQGVFRSADGGESWSPSNNGLPSGGATGVGPNVLSLAIQPLNRLVLYAGLASGRASASVYRSTDGGSAWSPLSSIKAEGAIQPMAPTILAFYPDSPNSLAAGTASGVFQSTDGGASWSPANKRLAEPVVSLAFQPKDYTTLYAATQNGIYKTARDNVDWQKLNVKTPSVLIRALSIAPDGALYVSTTYGEEAGRRSSAIRSTDGGSSWSPVLDSLENTEPQAFAFDPSNPRTIYATTLAGVFQSTDGGSRWSRLGFSLLPTPTPQPETTVSGVITETSALSLTLRMIGDDRQAWQIVLNQDPLRPTQISYSDGTPALFADLKALSRVSATGKIDARSPVDGVLAARSITIAASRPSPTATVVPSSDVTTTARIDYLYDPKNHN